MGSSVNLLNPNVDLTVRVYDEFYDYAIDVPTNEYDVVNSFFLSIMDNATSAENFTAALFRVAQETNVSAFELMQSLDTNNLISLTASLAYYLNGIRSPSTLLGINATVTPNVWAARNVKP